MSNTELERVHPRSPIWGAPAAVRLAAPPDVDKHIYDPKRWYETWADDPWPERREARRIMWESRNR